MKKEQVNEILKICKDIEKESGKGSIFSLNNNEVLEIPRFSTGIEDLDEVLGGGIPKGRMIEIFGAESSGKTSLAYHLCGLQEMCLFIPAEGTFDKKRAVVFGNRPKQMLVYNSCKYAEDIMEKMIKFSKAGIPLIVVDSVPYMTPKSLYEQTLKDAEKQPQRGQLASFFSRTLKPLNDIIERTGTTIIFINQIRDKMDAMMFGEKFDTCGGHALKHAMSIRIMVARKSFIEVPNKNPCNSSLHEKVGIITKVKVKKNKTAPPLMECELPMFFDRGYVGFDDVDEIRKEIMKENNKKYKGIK